MTGSFDKGQGSRSFIARYDASPLFRGVLAFVLPAVLLTISCALLRITPFGDNTFLFNDMKRQYLDFFACYKRILTTDENFLYSFSNGPGGGMIGFAAYYLTSPLLLPFVFVTANALPVAVTALIIVKLSLCGLTANVFLSDTLRHPASLILSTAYSLCAYNALNATNIMWIDVVIIFPALLLTAKRLREGAPRSFTAYTALLFLSLFTNYYITYMVAIFLLAEALIFFKDIRGFLRFASASLLAGALCSFLLVPTFIGLTRSGKNGFAFGKGIYLPDLPLKDILSKCLSLSFDGTQIFDGSPALYCGLFVMAGMMYYFFHPSVAFSEKIRSGVLTAILVLSTMYAKVDYVWHAFSEPEGYRYRYSFILSFLAISLAWRAFVLSLEREETKSLVTPFVISLAVTALAVAYGLTSRMGYLLSWIRLTNIALAIVTITLLFLLFFLWRKGSPGARAVLIIIALVQSADLSMNFCYTYKHNGFLQQPLGFYWEKVATDGAFVKEILAADDGFYRVESASPRSENDAMLYGYHGVSVYSSETNMTLRTFMQRIGFSDNTFLVTYDDNNTELTDRLFGIRYKLSGTDEPYRALTPTLPMALPLDITPEKLKEKSAAVDKAGDPFAFSEGILNSVSTEPSQVLFPADVLDMSVTEATEDMGGSMEFSLKTKASGKLYFYAVNLPEEEDMMFTVNGNELPEHFGNLSCYRVFSLGVFKSGEEIDVTISNLRNILSKDDCLFVTEDIASLDKAIAPLEAYAADVDVVSSSSLTVRVNEGASSLLMLIPYSDEWQVSIDGQRVTTFPLFDLYMGIPLDAAADASVVTMKYVPSGLYAGLAISAAAAVITLLLLIRMKRSPGGNR